MAKDGCHRQSQILVICKKFFNARRRILEYLGKTGNELVQSVRAFFHQGEFVAIKPPVTRKYMRNKQWFKNHTSDIFGKYLVGEIFKNTVKTFFWVRIEKLKAPVLQLGNIAKTLFRQGVIIMITPWFRGRKKFSIQ